MAAPAPRDAKRARPAALEARVSTIELPELGRVCSVLAVKGGARFLGTQTALYLQVDGRLALLAGHPSEEGFKDGQGVEARFNIIAGLGIFNKTHLLSSCRAAVFLIQTNVSLWFARHQQHACFTGLI